MVVELDSLVAGGTPMPKCRRDRAVELLLGFMDSLAELASLGGALIGLN
jgi:hypothetical protein